MCYGRKDRTKQSLLLLALEKHLWWAPFWETRSQAPLSYFLEGFFARGPWELVSILKWQTRDRSIDDIITKPVHPVFCEYDESLSAPSFRSIVEVCDSLKMPRNGRRKRSLSSEEGSLVSYYSKHRFIDREHSPVSDTRHYKRGSSTVRSRDRRHNRHLSRNRSRSTRRSDRRLKRQKCRNDPSEVSTVRNSFLPIFRVF